MKSRRYGRIVNISSGAGRSISLTGIQAYASAKAGQIGLTRQLAHELGPWGITVNNIAPGFVRSNPTTERQWKSYGADGQSELVERIALRRLGTAADIAHGVLFFASEFAGWITGQVRTIPTSGNAVIYGEWLGAPGKLTALVYGHYDVQPPDPLDRWISPPFSPTVREGRLYARGVSDDKGPMLIPIAVAEAFFSTAG